jgi:hypothetical protein
LHQAGGVEHGESRNKPAARIQHVGKANMTFEHGVEKRRGKAILADSSYIFTARTIKTGVDATLLLANASPVFQYAGCPPVTDAIRVKSQR